jgi:phosphoserine phosphatase
MTGAGTAGLLPAGLDATLVLVRHGESDWITKGLFQGQGDSPLSPLGRRQADLVARRLAEADRPPVLPIPHRPPWAIVHSPLDRAADTARRIAAALAEPLAGRSSATVPLRPEAGFLEIGQGEWEGVPSIEVDRRWHDLLEAWRDDPLTAWAPGGESVQEVDARVRVALGDIFVALAGEAPMPDAQRGPVLGYGDAPPDVPWTIVVAHDGVFKVAALALLELPLERFWMLPFALCGISVVEIRDGRSRLRVHNATDHLATLETDTTLAEADRSEAGAF